MADSHLESPPHLLLLDMYIEKLSKLKALYVLAVVIAIRNQFEV